MRSTTVGWPTSIVRVRPVSADHIWLNKVRPESRDNINHPIEPRQNIPMNSPRIRAKTMVAKDRVGLEGGTASGSRGILQGYHPASEQLTLLKSGDDPATGSRLFHGLSNSSESKWAFRARLWPRSRSPAATAVLD